MLLSKTNKSIRGTFYLTARRILKFRNWERYYKEVCQRGSSLSHIYLRRILKYARSHVPYYRDILHKISDQDISLTDFPILNKNIIRTNFAILKTDELHQRKWFKNSSGGSTGMPQTFIQDQEFVEWSQAALTFYFRDFLGIEYAVVPKVVFWGSERDIFKQRQSWEARIANWLTRTYYVNSFKMSPEVMQGAVNLINTVKPVFIKGYASSLYEFARFIKQHNSIIYKPQFLYSSAETLQPFMRQLIEDVFEVKVFNFYGSREVGAIAGECQKGMMHVFSFNNYVEIVDNSGNLVGQGQEGRVLITTLHNYVMPLIRYEIGDRAIVGKHCVCGSNLPILARITGRLTDNFLTKDKTVVHGEYFTHLFYFRDWISEFHILQEMLDKIIIFIVMKEATVLPKNEQDEINKKILLVMGNDCQIEWKIVDEVPRTPQGKLLFTRSLVYGK